MSNLFLLLAALFASLVIWLIYRARLTFRKRESEQPPLPRPHTDLATLIPDSCYVEVEGVQVHYVQGGKGPDLVLLHGIGASVFIWRFLFPLLQTHYRVTALDLPGFGRSSKGPTGDYGLDAQMQIVAKSLTAIGIKKAFLVGSSMGGAITLWLAKHFPERFGRVAVLAPATDSRLAPAFARHFAGVAPIFRRALNRATMRIILKRVVARHELVSDEVINSYLDPFLDNGEAVRAFWAATSLIADPRLPSELDAIKSEVLVIYGERDLMVPRKSIDGLMTKIPQARLVTHPAGGHHIMEDEPEWIVFHLDRFFRHS